MLISSASESVVSFHHEYEDQNMEQKEVSLSALSADCGLNAITAVVAITAHRGAAPLSLCILTNPNTTLWLTLSVWNLKNTIPLLLLSGLLLLRLGHHLTLSLIARHLSKK
jgi:hypothetical protein